MAPNSDRRDEVPLSAIPSNTSVVRKSPDIDGGWAWVIAVASLTACGISSGLYYTFSMYYVLLLNEFQSSRALIAWVGSLNNGIFMLAGPIATQFINRIGTRYTIMLGGVTALLGYSLSSVAPNITILFLTYSVMGGFGCCLNYTGWIIAMSTFFQKKYSIMFSISQGGVGVGIFIFGPLFQLLINEYGWRGSFLISGAIAFHLTLLGALVFPPRQFKNRDEDQSLLKLENQEIKQVEEKGCKDPAFPTVDIMRDVTAWLLHFNSFFWLLATSILYILLADYTRSKSLEEYYIYMLSTMGIADLFGRTLSGPIVEYWKIDVITLYTMSQLICAVSIFSFLFVYDGVQMIVQGFIYSFTFGVQCVLMTIVLRSIYGSKNLNQVFGINMFFGGVGILIGPPIAGFLVDFIGSYMAAFVFAGSAELIACIFSYGSWCSIKRKIFVAH